MKSIWKFRLTMDGEQEVIMPGGADILRIGMQNGAAYLWALVDINAAVAGRTIFCRGTGHECDENICADLYIGTTEHDGGALIFHWFA